MEHQQYTVMPMARERTIKLSEQEYQALRKAQREHEARKRKEMEDLEPDDPDEEEKPGVDWGSVALGAVAVLGAVALVSYLKKRADQQNQQQGQNYP